MGGRYHPNSEKNVPFNGDIGPNNLKSPTTPNFISHHAIPVVKFDNS